MGGSPGTALNPRVPCPFWSLLLLFPSGWCEMMLVSNRLELLKEKKVLFLSNRNSCNQSFGCKMRVIVTIIAIQMCLSSLSPSVHKKP